MVLRVKLLLGVTEVLDAQLLRLHLGGSSGPSSLGPATHVGDVDRVPDSWLQLYAALAVGGIRSEPVDGRRSLFLPVIPAFK